MEVRDSDWNSTIALQQVTSLWADGGDAGDDTAEGMTLEGAVAAVQSGAFGMEVAVDESSESDSEDEAAAVAKEQGVLFSTPKADGTLRKYFMQQQMHFLRTVNDEAIKLTVDSKAEKKTVEKSLQGDESMYTAEMIAARQKLKDHPDMKRIIKSLWALMPKVKLEQSAMMMQSTIGHSFDLDNDGKVDTSKAFRKVREPTQAEKDSSPGSVQKMNLGKMPASPPPASLTPPDAAVGCTTNVINKNIYFALCARLFKRLVKSGTHRECLASLDAEWRKDSINDEFVNYARFAGTIFDTIDVWCPSVDVKQYEAFVDKVLKPIAIEVCVLDPQHKFKLGSVYPELRRHEKRAEAKAALAFGRSNPNGNGTAEEGGEGKAAHVTQRTQELAKPKSDLHDYSRESHQSAEKDAGVVAKGHATPPAAAITTIAESGVAIGREATPPVPPNERQAKSVIPPHNSNTSPRNRDVAAIRKATTSHDNQPPELTVVSYGSPVGPGAIRFDDPLRYCDEATDGKRIASTRTGYLPSDGVSVLVAANGAQVDELEATLKVAGNLDGALQPAQVLGALRQSGTVGAAHLAEQVALAVGRAEGATAEVRIFIPSSTNQEASVNEGSPLPIPQLMCAASLVLRSEPDAAASVRTARSSSRQSSGSGGSGRANSAAKRRAAAGVKVINLCLFDGEQPAITDAVIAGATSSVPVVVDSTESPAGSVSVDAAGRVLTSLFAPRRAEDPQSAPEPTADPDMESSHAPQPRAAAPADATTLEALTVVAEEELAQGKLDYCEPAVTARQGTGQVALLPDDPDDPHADRYALVYPAPTVAIAHKAAIGRKLTVHRPWQEPRVGVPVPPRPQAKLTFPHTTTASPIVETAKRLRKRELPPVVAISNIASEVTLDEHTAAHLRMSVPQHSAVSARGPGKRVICVDDVHPTRAEPERVTIMGATKPIAAVSAARSFKFTIYEPYDAAHLVHKLTNTHESVVKRYLHQRVDPPTGASSPKALTSRGHNGCGMLESVIVEHSRHTIRSPTNSPVKQRALKALATGARSGVMDVTRGLADADVSAQRVELPNTASARLGKLYDGPTEATQCVQELVKEHERMPYDERLASEEASALAEALARKHASQPRSPSKPAITRPTATLSPAAKKPGVASLDGPSAVPFSLASQAFAAPPLVSKPAAPARGNINKHDALGAAIFKNVPQSQTADAYLELRMQQMLSGASVAPPVASTAAPSEAFDPRGWSSPSQHSDRLGNLTFSRKPVVYID